jgi:hypothetical protein
VNAPSRADLRLAAVACGAVSLYDALLFLGATTGLFVFIYRIDFLFPDFMVFHAAARAVLEGKAGIVYDTAALTHLQNTLYAGRLPFELGFRPFLYPPLWLLAVLPFGWLSLSAAAVAFLALSIAAASAGMRASNLSWLAIAAILTGPAALWVVISGQNTFLSLALLYGGLALSERKPVLAGVLLGLLAYKPQLFVLVPLALFCARSWHALAALIVTVVLLTLATLLLFGPDLWIAFLESARVAASPAAAAEMYDRVGNHMVTLLAAAKAVGLANGPAATVQLAGSLLAIAAVGWVFFRHPHSQARTAVLVAATMLVSPYTLNYDLLILMPAVALSFLYPPPAGYLPAERVLLFVVWLLPHLCLELNAAGIPIGPPVIFLFAAVAWARLRGAAKVELREPVGAR